MHTSLDAKLYGRPKIDQSLLPSGCIEVRRSSHFILTLLEFSYRPVFYCLHGRMHLFRTKMCWLWASITWLLGDCDGTRWDGSECQSAALSSPHSLWSLLLGLRFAEKRNADMKRRKSVPVSIFLFSLLDVSRTISANSFHIQIAFYRTVTKCIMQGVALGRSPQEIQVLARFCLSVCWKKIFFWYF